MTWERPAWYMTTEEFAELVVSSLEQTGHFNRNEQVHPEDIVVAFTTQAEAIALGAGFAGRKVYEHGRQTD